MRIISISTAAALTAAIAAAIDGDILSCGPGNYGTVNISRAMGVGGLTITSADQTDANRAVFNFVNMFNSDRITFSFVKFDYVRGGTAIFTPTFVSYDSKRTSLLYNLFDGDFGTDGTGWGAAIQMFGNVSNSSFGHTILGNRINKYNYGIQLDKSNQMLIQGNEIWDISNDFMQFKQVDTVDVIHNKGYLARLPPGSLAHPDFNQTFTTATTVPSKNVRWIRNIMDARVGSFCETLFANNELFYGGNSSFYYENFQYLDNWLMANHLHCITINAANGVTIEGNNLIAAPLDPTDPFNQGYVTNYGGGYNDSVWIPRINVDNCIGAVSVQHNRFWAGPLHTASRVQFTGSTAGFVVGDNILNKDAPGPAMPTFTLGGDGLGSIIIPDITNGCTFRGGY